MKFVNVRQNPDVFGDGIHDDTRALQACIDEVKDGGTVYFPDGTYLLSGSLIFYSYQQLKFSDKAVLLRSAKEGKLIELVGITEGHEHHAGMCHADTAPEGHDVIPVDTVGTTEIGHGVHTASVDDAIVVLHLLFEGVVVDVYAAHHIANVAARFQLLLENVRLVHVLHNEFAGALHIDDEELRALGKRERDDVLTVSNEGDGLIGKLICRRFQRLTMGGDRSGKRFSVFKQSCLILHLKNTADGIKKSLSRDLSAFDGTHKEAVIALKREQKHIAAILDELNGEAVGRANNTRADHAHRVGNKTALIPKLALQKLCHGGIAERAGKRAKHRIDVLRVLVCGEGDVTDHDRACVLLEHLAVHVAIGFHPLFLGKRVYGGAEMLIAVIHTVTREMLTTSNNIVIFC